MSDEERDRKEKIAGVFSRAASTYDRVGPRYFAHFGKRLVEVAHIAPGASVLDVAAGRGAVLFPALQQVGPRGRVTGIDLSTEMVCETAAEIQDAGWANAEMLQMDAEELRFADATFDWVLCGFSIWFFPKPQRALAEFFRVLKPEGNIGVTTWARDCPTQTSCNRAVRQYLPPQYDQGQEPSRFDTPPILEAALQQAGFRGIKIFAEDGEFIYANEEEWWSSLWAAGRRRYLEQMTVPVQQDVKADLFQEVQVLKQQDKIRAVRRALFAIGNKRSITPDLAIGSRGGIQSRSGVDDPSAQNKAAPGGAAEKESKLEAFYGHANRRSRRTGTRAGWSLFLRVDCASGVFLVP